MRLPGFVYWLLLLSFAGLVPGCDESKAPIAEQSPQQNAAASELSPRSSRPAAERVVAIGDLHGDLGAAKKALRAAGATDDRGAWIGGKLVVVQTGDQIDRGAEDREVLDLFERLKGEAARAGGELISLAGNHEIMNVQFDFRYVVPEAYRSEAASFAPSRRPEATSSSVGRDLRGRHEI